MALFPFPLLVLVQPVCHTSAEAATRLFQRLSLLGQARWSGRGRPGDRQRLHMTLKSLNSAPVPVLELRPPVHSSHPSWPGIST